MVESMNDFEKELEASFRKISEGDIISGTVIAVDEEEITLDLKYYTQGIIKISDYTNDPDFNAKEDVHEGDVIEATVVKTDDGQGNILLSKKEANDILAWDKLKELLDNNTVVKVRVKESVNAGVIAYLEGIRAFIPASQLAADFVEDTSTFVGKELDVRVITVDKANEKLVLSAKSVIRELEADKKKHQVSMLVPGTVCEGTVETLTNYGAFISLGNGLSGLVHISQISMKRINKPSEVLKVGDHVKVKILNTNDGKISLSMKALEEEMASELDSEVQADIEQYSSKESATTSLGDLLSKFKFD